MLANATRICEANFGNLFLYEDEAFRAVARCTMRRPHMRAAPHAIRPSVPGRTRASAAAPNQGRCRSDRRPEGRAGTSGFDRSRGRRELAASGPCSAYRCCKENELIGAISDLPPGGTAFHRQADRAGAELRQPGGHRHREHPPAQRAAQIAAAADRHRRRAQGHQPLDLRSADRARYTGRFGGATVRGGYAASSRRTARAYRQVATYGFPPEIKAYMPSHPSEPGRGSVAGRGRWKAAVHIHDVLADPEYKLSERGAGGSAPCSASRCCAKEYDRRSCLASQGGTPIHREADRAGPNLRRPGGDRDRERTAVRRDPGQEPPARRGEPAQVAVPRQHEPRAAHPAQRHHRRHRDAARGCRGPIRISSRSIACSVRPGTCSP